MKLLMSLKLVLILTFFTSLSWAEEVVTEEISSSKKWSAYKMTGHSAWGTEACVASTQGEDSIVEIYSEKVGSVYTEPTIQVLFSGVAEQVFSATIETDKGGRKAMTLASQPAAAGMQAVMSRLKDRESLIRAIRGHNSLTVRLRDAKGKTIKRLRFSLSGSSKTVKAQTAACALEFSKL